MVKHRLNRRAATHGPWRRPICRTSSHGIDSVSVHQCISILQLLIMRPN